MPEAVAGAGWWVPTLATSGCPYRPSRWLRSGPPTLEQYGPRVVRLAVDADRGCCGNGKLGTGGRGSGQRWPPTRWQRRIAGTPSTAVGARVRLLGRWQSVPVRVSAGLRMLALEHGAERSTTVRVQAVAAAEANVVAAAPAGT